MVLDAKAIAAVAVPAAVTAPATAAHAAAATGMLLHPMLLLQQ